MSATAFVLKHIDTHTHIHFSAYDFDRDLVIERARSNGIGMIQIGSNLDTSKKALDLANSYSDGMWVCVGLHPIHTVESFDDQIGGMIGGEVFEYSSYRTLAEEKKVIGIGECGLDYFHIKQDKERNLQKEVFIQQIRLSSEVKKPLMIHCRDAYHDLISILEKEKSLLNDCSGVIHFFSGSVEESKKLLDLGFYFTFGGAITYPKKKDGYSYEEIVRAIPLNRILSETDSPYVAPIPYRGKRNESLYVLEVEKRIAELKEISQGMCAEQIIKNANALFGI